MASHLHPIRLPGYLVEHPLGTFQVAQARSDRRQLLVRGIGEVRRIVAVQHLGDLLEREPRVDERPDNHEAHVLVGTVVAVAVVRHLGRLEQTELVVVDERVAGGRAEPGKLAGFDEVLGHAPFTAGYWEEWG